MCVCLRLLFCATGIASPFCGSHAASGFVDGPCSSALFGQSIPSLAYHNQVLFVADVLNNAVRAIDMAPYNGPSGQFQRLKVSPDSRSDSPWCRRAPRLSVSLVHVCD